MPLGHDPAADGEQHYESSDNGPAVFFQRIGRVDGNAESAAGTAALGLRILVHGTALWRSARRSCCSALLIGNRSGARDRESQRLAYVCLLSNLDDAVGLIGVLHGFERRRVAAFEVHGLGQDDYKMLGGIERLGIDLRRAVVRESELELDLSFSGAQRESDSVTALFRLRNGIGWDGLPVGRFGLDLFDLGADGKIELKAVVVHLRDRRRRLVVDGE